MKIIKGRIVWKLSPYWPKDRSFVSSKLCSHFLLPRDIFLPSLSVLPLLSLILNSVSGYRFSLINISIFLAMESLINASSAGIVSSSSSFPISSPIRNLPLRSFQVPHASKGIHLWILFQFLFLLFLCFFVTRSMKSAGLLLVGAERILLIVWLWLVFEAIFCVVCFVFFILSFCLCLGMCV